MKARPLCGRVALVTGASRGIGYAAALALAGAGAHVVAVARTIDRLEELYESIKTAGGDATLMPLDLKDHGGIAHLTSSLFDRHKKLDILVGNAGMNGPLSPLSSVESETWENVIAVNLTANWQLIRNTEPLLKQSDAGRAVFVSSGLSWRGLPSWGPYAVSKAALNAMVQAWAAENSSTALRINLFSPGPVRTRMRTEALPYEDPSVLETPENIAEKLLEMCLPTFKETGKIYIYPINRLAMLQAPK